MDIDPTQPWGIAIDYFGRATVTEAGHTVQIRVYDQTMGEPVVPDPYYGTYPTVYINARITEAGDGGTQLYGSGDLMVQPVGTDPVVPNQTAVPDTVAAAVADFEANRANYAALCAAWAEETPSAAAPSSTPGTSGAAGPGPSA